MKKIEIVTHNDKIVISFFKDEKFIRSETFNHFGNKFKIAIKEFVTQTHE